MCFWFFHNWSQWIDSGTIKIKVIDLDTGYESNRTMFTQIKTCSKCNMKKKRRYN